MDGLFALLHYERGLCLGGATVISHFDTKIDLAFVTQCCIANELGNIPDTVPSDVHKPSRRIGSAAGEIFTKLKDPDRVIRNQLPTSAQKLDGTRCFSNTRIAGQKYALPQDVYQYSMQLTIRDAKFCRRFECGADWHQGN